MAPGPSGWAQAGEPQRASSKRMAQTVRIRILLGGSVERFLRVLEDKVSATSEKRPTYPVLYWYVTTIGRKKAGRTGRSAPPVCLTERTRTSRCGSRRHRGGSGSRRRSGSG